VNSKVKVVPVRN